MQGCVGKTNCTKVKQTMTMIMAMAMTMAMTKARKKPYARQSGNIFRFPEIDAMLREIGCIGNDAKRMFNGWSNILGDANARHPTVNKCQLFEWIKKKHPEAKNMSPNDWLKQHSTFPVEKWRFYLGID